MNLSKNSTNCNCLKLLDTYAIIEKNLIKNIDILQYEKNQIIHNYEHKFHELQKELQNSIISQNNKIKLLGKELLNEKIAKHELENKLKLLEDNLRCNTFLNKTIHVPGEISSAFKIKEHINNLGKLVKNLRSKISSRSRPSHEEGEILNILDVILSDINLIRWNENEVHKSNISR